MHSPKQFYCGNYNADIDPSASNEFSHAAYRQFHQNIPEKFNFYDDCKQNDNLWVCYTSKFLYFFIKALKAYKTVPLYETDNGPAILEKEYNGVLLGLLKDPSIEGPTSFSDTVNR